MHPFLNDQRADRHAAGFGWIPDAGIRKGLAVFLLDLSPGHDLGQFDPTIFYIQAGAGKTDRILMQTNLVG